MWHRSTLLGRGTVWFVVIGCGLVSVPRLIFAQRSGKLQLRVVDESSGQPIAVRMHLRDSRNRPVVPRGFVSWHDHFVFDGKAELELPPGEYTFQLERGPEYLMRTGRFSIQRGANDVHTLTMKRFVDMTSHGWYSGDLHIHRRPEDIPLLAAAEDLHVLPVITWWNRQNPWQGHKLPADRIVWCNGRRSLYDLMAGEDERGGGAMLYIGLSQPLLITQADREFPPTVHFLKMAKSLTPQVHIDAEKPFWWDLPIWLASGGIDSIGIAHNHMQRDGVLANEAWGRPRDRLRYPDPHGNGQWTQEIYYHVLNCGFRIAPSAGSASGVVPNPVGYNRVYVHLDKPLEWQTWFEGLRNGRVVVTNGPLMIPRANGKLPGHVFRADEGQRVTIPIELVLHTREKIEYLEIVQNGNVLHQVRLDALVAASGRLPSVQFDESGWFMVRAITNHPATYRFAATGPYYVQIGNSPRISRRSVKFFLDWLQERQSAIESLPMLSGEDRRTLLEVVEDARRFWNQRLTQANAD